MLRHLNWSAGELDEFTCSVPLGLQRMWVLLLLMLVSATSWATSDGTIQAATIDSELDVAVSAFEGEFRKVQRIERQLEASIERFAAITRQLEDPSQVTDISTLLISDELANIQLDINVRHQLQEDIVLRIRTELKYYHKLLHSEYSNMVQSLRYKLRYARGLRERTVLKETLGITKLKLRFLERALGVPPHTRRYQIS